MAIDVITTTKLPPDGDEARALVLQAMGFEAQLPTPEFLSIMDIHEPPPFPILREAGACGSILAGGEICVLAGPGKSGKSTLTAQIAMAASAMKCSHGFGKTAGLEVRKGPVLLLSYEDTLRRIKDRIELIAQQESLWGSGFLGTRLERLQYVKAVNMDGRPLFGVPEGAHMATRPRPLSGWGSVWNEIREQSPVLVVIDPAGDAYIASQNDPAGVRSFFGAVRREAEQVGENGCGVLIVHHSTKGDRDSDARTEGAVSGTAAWTDKARAAVTLNRDRAPDRYEGPTSKRKLVERGKLLDSYTLECERANYAPAFSLTLKSIMHQGYLAGFHETDEDNPTIRAEEI